MTKIKLMVDSGAFSAWRQGKTVSLDDYCGYLLANQDIITHYINLDEIIPDDPEEAAKRSMDNFVLMRSRDLNPLPVLHVREDVSWLKRMLDMGCDYVCLAATSISSIQATDDWYEMMWEHLVDASGAPIVRVHALGEQRERILKRYPWASADATSWSYSMRFGQVYADFDKKLSFGHSTSRTMPDASDLGEFDRDELARAAREFGIDPKLFEGERKGPKVYLPLGYMAASQMRRLEETVRAVLPIRFKRGPSLLFDPDTPEVRPVEFPDEFDLYLGTSSLLLLPCLHKATANRVLVSYWYLTGGRDKQLRAYVERPDETIAGYRNFLILSEVLSDASVAA